MRANLADNGIAFQNNFTQFYFGGAGGGLEQEFRYSGHGDYLTNLDFGKLGVQEGLFLKIRAEHRLGESLVGVTGSVMPAIIAADLPDGEKEDLFISNFLFTQALSESFVLFAGKFDSLDGDLNAYAHGRGISQFSNMAMVANPLPLRTVPYSMLGAGFAFLLDGEPLLNFAIVNPVDTVGTVGLNELFAEGVTLTSEMRVPTQFFGRPGHQLIGGSWSSRSVTSLGQDPRVVLPNVPIARQSNSWSLYWNCDQQLVQNRCNPDLGWGYFARAGIADSGTNPLAYFMSVGLGGNSPIAGRENDRFGVGYYYLATSDEIGPLLNLALGTIGDENGVEMFYNAAISPNLSITPDFQVLSSARESVSTALVAGIRANLAF